MTRVKKTIKAKEPVKIRFKQIANGNQSIYLDIYKNGVRHYEFLKMYLIPEVDNDSKIANINTMNAVQAIKAKMILDIANDEANISKSSYYSKMLLIDWMREYQDLKLRKGQSDGFSKNVDKTIKHLIKYKGSKITLKQVDKKFCKGFIEYLMNAKKKDGEQLSQATARNYYKIFNCALNRAVKDRIIKENPFAYIEAEDKIQQPESKREFLTIEEVKALMATPCKNESIKRAFLFCCFTGLRCSDCEALRWQDIKRDGDRTYIDINVIKTRRDHQETLSEQALHCLPEQGDALPSSKVFGFPKSNYHNVVIKEWAKDAGITKDISFHVSRHTLATLGLTANIDLYTISKLLGHTQLKTTQIYAKVIDKKKDEAVNAVSNLF